MFTLVPAIGHSHRDDIYLTKRAMAHYIVNSSCFWFSVVQYDAENTIDRASLAYINEKIILLP